MPPTPASVKDPKSSHYVTTRFQLEYEYQIPAFHGYFNQNHNIESTCHNMLLFRIQIWYQGIPLLRSLKLWYQISIISSRFEENLTSNRVVPSRLCFGSPYQISMSHRAFGQNSVVKSETSTTTSIYNPIWNQHVERSSATFKIDLKRSIASLAEPNIDSACHDVLTLKNPASSQEVPSLLWGIIQHQLCMSWHDSVKNVISTQGVLL